MGVYKGVAAGLAAVSLLAGNPAAARGDTASAEKLRRLDIMLMVTSLRCRFGADDFQADYQRFSARHLGELNAAGSELRADLSARYGAAGANKELDRMSVRMANEYGLGHPWLDCAGLKQAARNLAAEQDSVALAAAADSLLDRNPPATIGILARR